ncbi:MAG: RNA 2',3'-cyclic phosphodiesterase [Atopobiaceae bacterium]
MDEAREEPRRLFMALLFSEEEREELEALAVAASGRMRRGTPARAENLHLTLAFLGMCDAATEARARTALAAAAQASAPVDETLGELGHFDHRRSSVIWRGVEEESGLRALQANVAEELRQQSVPFDEKPFVPHVTLVRGAAPKAGDALDEVLLDLSRKSRALPVHHAEAALMWSHHPEGGHLIYTPLARFPLLA